MVTRSGEAALALDAALPPERPLPSGIASSVCRVCRPPRKAGIRLGRRVAGAGGGTASPAPPALQRIAKRFSADFCERIIRKRLPRVMASRAAFVAEKLAIRDIAVVFSKTY